MPITEEKLKKLKDKANEFRKYTGIILDVTQILDDIEDEKDKEYYDAFLFAYKNAMNRIVPAMMGMLQSGQELPPGIGTYLNDIMNLVHSATASKEEKRIDTITKDLKKSEMYGHILEEHYDNIVAEAFQKNNHILGTIPEYKEVANLPDNEWKNEYTIRKTIIDATFTTAKHDVTWGELNEEDFHKMVKTLSEPYMAIREKYNQYNWFQKWFLRKGTEERYYMNLVKDELNSIKNKLGFKCDIKDELHKEGAKLKVVTPEKQALLTKAVFDMKKPITVQQVVEKKPENKLEVKAENKPEVKAENKLEVKPENKIEKAPERRVEKNLFDMDDAIDVNDKILFDIKEIEPIVDNDNEKEQNEAQAENETINVWDL